MSGGVVSIPVPETVPGASQRAAPAGAAANRVATSAAETIRRNRRVRRTYRRARTPVKAIHHFRA
jgi:hypothetical protein